MLGEAVAVLLLTGAGLWLVRVVTPDRWPNWRKRAFRLAIWPAAFILLGLYWLYQGELPVETTYRQILCPLSPSALKCEQIEFRPRCR